MAMRTFIKEHLNLRWGVSYYDYHLQFRWRGKTWVWELPFGWRLRRQSYLMSGGRMNHHYPHQHAGRLMGLPEEYYQHWFLTYPFHSRTPTGEVEYRLIRVFHEEREYRRRGLRWISLFRKTYREFRYQLSDPLPPAVTQWTRDTPYSLVGTLDVRPHETVEKAIKRLENERSFN